MDVYRSFIVLAANVLEMKPHSFGLFLKSCFLVNRNPLIKESSVVDKFSLLSLGFVMVGIVWLEVLLGVFLFFQPLSGMENATWGMLPGGFRHPEHASIATSCCLIKCQSNPIIRRFFNSLSLLVFPAPGSCYIKAI